MQKEKAVAVMAVMMGRGGPRRTLAEEAKVSMESAKEEARKTGNTLVWSDALERKVGDSPAIEQEGRIVKNQVTVRELTIYVDSPDHTNCGLMYSTRAEDFDQYKPLFDEAVKHFTCPNTSLAGTGDH